MTHRQSTVTWKEPQLLISWMTPAYSCQKTIVPSEQAVMLYSSARILNLISQWSAIKRRKFCASWTNSDSFTVDNPSFTTLLLLNWMMAPWKAVSEWTLSNPSAQTPNSLPNPAVNAWPPFAYGNEEEDPKRIKGFLLLEHADTDTALQLWLMLMPRITCMDQTDGSLFSLDFPRDLSPQAACWISKDGRHYVLQAAD